MENMRFQLQLTVHLKSGLLRPEIKYQPLVKVFLYLMLFSLQIVQPSVPQNYNLTGTEFNLKAQNSTLPGICLDFSISSFL